MTEEMVTDSLATYFLCLSFFTILAFVLLLLYVPLSFGLVNAFWHKVKGDDTSVIKDMFQSWKQNFWSAIGFTILLSLIGYGIVLAGIIAGAILLIIMVSSGVVSLDILSNLGAINYSEEGKSAVLIVVLIVIAIYTLIFAFAFVIEYMYCMTYYIKEDNPDKSIASCMKESRLLMKGKKWRLFVLDLTFIGWALLSILTLGIGCLWLYPYIYTTRACFYKDIAGIKDTKTIIEETTVIEPIE